MPSAEALVDHIATVVRTRLPHGVTVDYFDGFFTRNRAALVMILDRQLTARGPRAPMEAPPDLWSAAQRTAANLAGMRIAASKRTADLTDDDRRTLASYSGWGGLSLEGAAKQLPAGFPAPEPRGLIHEYYTPTKVAREVARLVRPLVPELPHDDGVVLALEPSAGIGRFVQAASGEGFDALRWLVVEWSELSARMLQALRPDVPVFQGPFERWVLERGPEYAGRVGLVLANPPYGARGVAVTDDPDRTYREKAAYAYFLRRALDLLAPSGLGVFLVPAGFLTGRAPAQHALREKVLRRHHLSAAFRLPSAIFPGAMLVTDLLFFRARGGELAEVDAADRFVLEGSYFAQHPGHVLGTEVGKDGGDDDQTARPRWGYQVVGTFERLPDLVERPICGACAVSNVVVFPSRPARGGVARRLEEATAGLSEPAATAVVLGLRVDRYLAAASAQTTDEHVQLWPELHEALLVWAKAHGNPLASAELRALAKEGRAGAERFLQAFTKSGALIAGLATKPAWTARYAGRSDDLVALAEWVYRTRRHLTRSSLAEALGAQSGLPEARAKAVVAERLPELLDAGWRLDGDAWDTLLPERDHLSGHLWPRYDRAMRAEPKRLPRGLSMDRVAAWARSLADAIRPAVLDDIAGVSPRQGWVPLDLVAEWLGAALNRHYGPVRLERREGLVQIAGLDYDRIEDAAELAAETRWCLGWINHDKTTFKPRKKKDENVDEVRLRLAAEWDRAFRAWVAADPDRAAQVEQAYNRHFKGYVAPTTTPSRSPSPGG
jgi:predicted RNA methylase